jgi:hypothetical protein
MVHWGFVVAYTFDSLGYAKRLRDGGVPQDQAEGHAEAVRDFIMAELVSKSDLLATKLELRASMTELQTDLRTTNQELRTTKQELQAELRVTKQELKTEISELRTRIDTQALRLTVRLGAMIVVALGALATILKLT